MISDKVASLNLPEICRHFDENGYCIIPDVLRPDELKIYRQALARIRIEDAQAGKSLRYGPNLSNERVWALLNRGEEFTRLALHPVILTVCKAMLGYSEILLSTITANITGPGGDHGIGALHADQSILPDSWPTRLMVNSAFFLDDYTQENGATVFVPGSHRTDTTPPSVMPPASTLGQITGRAGSLALWDGFLHHATGLNRTAGQERRGILATYFVPYLRPQENWCLTLDRDLLERHPGLAALTGFEEWQTFGGVHGGKKQGLNF